MNRVRQSIIDLRAMADADDRTARALGFGSDKAVALRRLANVAEKAQDAADAAERETEAAR